MGERRIATVSWLAVLLWMGLIFYLSHQPGEASAALSSGVTDVPGRSGEVGDVVIDSVGAAAGLVVFSLGSSLIKLRQKY
ncbi:VanZ family protein [Dethiobacter alkaliphilus]|uniref:hypothetical protein n=1 Tax=Dethiobacter alkaliphilus TaxID=427926 RepID=UPI0022262C7A|nr:hypothetical protein [Dethiobacter alkaliphilus]